MYLFVILQKPPGFSKFRPFYAPCGIALETTHP